VERWGGLGVGGEVVVVGRGVFVRVKGSGVMNRDMSRAGFRFESTFSTASYSSLR